MKKIDAPVNLQARTAAFILAVAGLAGFCTMSYEVLWFRVLRFFVDNSIHSFAIMLTAFLFGLTAGGFLFSRFIDSRKDRLLFLGFVEAGIGLLCILSVPVITHVHVVIAFFNRLFGEGFHEEFAIRFVILLFVMLPSTLLMGGAFPLIARIHADRFSSFGRPAGEVYGVNTAGGVLGSFAGGFVFVPFMGVQYGIVLVGFINILIGAACLLASRSKRMFKAVSSAGFALSAAVCTVATPPDAFSAIYAARYPPPEHRLLYLKENISGTTTVFKENRRVGRRYMLIDAVGEVSTDYFSMRAFRALSILPALYSPNADNALVVTFGSGIVAGSIATLPGMRTVDCVEICAGAFEAAKYFAKENHDVLKNQRVNFIVNDGRNYVLTAKKRYSIISADATHPSSSDSWILYTKEFYRLCAARLSNGGIMCQWLPLHGLPERDYKTIVKTFHSAFPYAALWYSGGNMTTGHTILVGSNRPLTIELQRAEALLADPLIKRDLGELNILSVYDLFNCFVTGQDSLDKYTSGVPLNTDDNPRLVFTRFRPKQTPNVNIESLMRFRRSIASDLVCTDTSPLDSLKPGLEKNYEAMTRTVEGLVQEFADYTLRMKYISEQPDMISMKYLLESRAMHEKMIAAYRSAQEINPDDRNTRFLLNRVKSEYEHLISFLEANAKRR